MLIGFWLEFGDGIKLAFSSSDGRPYSIRGRKDFHFGLPAELVIKKGCRDFYQPLDYMGIPFRCYRCHGFGHLAHECSLPFNKPSSTKVWRVKKGGNQSDAKVGSYMEENLDMHFGSLEPEHLPKLKNH